MPLVTSGAQVAALDRPPTPRLSWFGEPVVGVLATGTVRARWVPRPPALSSSVSS